MLTMNSAVLSSRAIPDGAIVLRTMPLVGANRWGVSVMRNGIFYSTSIHKSLKAARAAYKAR